MKEKKYSMDTLLVHAGEPRPLIMGAVSIPVFQSSTFEYSGQSDYHSLKYIRLNNTPNHIALHQKIAEAEGAEDAIVAASGMGIISSVLLAVLSYGDHLLAQDGIYGGTHAFLTEDLPKMGITFDYFDSTNPDSWEKKIQPNTRVILTESITNPLMRVMDHEKLVSFAGAHNLISVIDNTFTTPVNYKPLETGYDISLHSCTKYMNGHSDIVGGAACGNAELTGKVKKKLSHMGASMDPHACFLLHRGMKTLALRMARHNENGLEVAEFLQSHPKVKKVNYPGLVTHPDHQRAKALFRGFGGMISFELDMEEDAGIQKVDRFLESLELPISAPSLGGVESLITRPATTSHSAMPKADREKFGIKDSLVRLSLGIESHEDIIADLEQALDTLDR